jgi:hypothetical protein
VIGEQVHAATAVLGREPLGELGAERRRVAPTGPLELGREGPHPAEVGLPSDLLVGVGRGLGVVAELVGDRLDRLLHRARTGTS